MSARRLLGHDPAVSRVEVGLRGDHVGFDRLPVADNGDGSFVAASLDSENAGHKVGISATSTPEATSAYSRCPSWLTSMARTLASAGARSWRITSPSRLIWTTRA